MFPRLEQTTDGASIDGSNSHHGFREGFEVANETAPLKPTKIKRDFGFRCVVISSIVVTVAITVALIIQIYLDKPVFFQSDVASDNEQCSNLGLQIMQEGGSAVDCAITTYLCLSVVHPHVAGLGGGGFMLIRDKNREITSLDFREAAPLSISPAANLNSPILTVGVPGVLHGLSTAHKLHGKLEWSQLVTPVSKFARDGFFVSSYLAQALKYEKQQFPSIFEIPQNASYDNMLGRKIQRKKYARTLDMIAKYGSDVMYNGSLKKIIVDQIKSYGGLLGNLDFSQYMTIVSKPLQISWKDFRLSTSPPPSSGDFLVAAMSFFENITSTVNNSMSDLVPQLLEAWKASSWIVDQLDTSQNSTSLIAQLKMLLQKASLNMDFKSLEPESRVSRASSVVAVDSEETFVSLISGLGSWFGSQIIVENGIILNDALKDFSPSLLKPGLRPPTTMSAVVIDQENLPCGFRLITSGSNSQLVLQMLLENLLLNKSLAESIKAARFAFSLDDKNAFVEENYYPSLDENVLNNLKINNFKITEVQPPYISINVVSKSVDDVNAYTDARTNVTF